MIRNFPKAPFSWVIPKNTSIVPMCITFSVKPDQDKEYNTIYSQTRFKRPPMRRPK